MLLYIQGSPQLYIVLGRHQTIKQYFAQFNVYIYLSIKKYCHKYCLHKSIVSTTTNIDELKSAMPKPPSAYPCLCKRDINGAQKLYVVELQTIFIFSAKSSIESLERCHKSQIIKQQRLTVCKNCKIRH